MTDTPIRVLLVEDHAVFRQALAFALEREQDLVVVGQAGTVAEARALLPGRPVDVAVVDFDLPDGTGVEVIRALHVAHRGAEAVLLTGSASRLQLAMAIEGGAIGVLPKSALLEEIVAAVRRVCDGKPVTDPAELAALLREATEKRAQNGREREAFARLTRREREVLCLLAEGLGDKEMAERMFVSKETVRSHMAKLLDKLGVESRLQVVLMAARHGEVRLGAPPP